MPIGFRGQIYAKSNAAASDAVRRFETSELKLSRCIIQVTANNQSFGLAAVYPVYLTPGEKMELIDVDLSTLYFINYTAGSNGTVGIVGVYAD